MTSNLVAVKTRHGQVYVYRVDPRTGKKVRVSSADIKAAAAAAAAAPSLPATVPPSKPAKPRSRLPAKLPTARRRDRHAKPPPPPPPPAPSRPHMVAATVKPAAAPSDSQDAKWAASREPAKPKPVAAAVAAAVDEEHAADRNKQRARMEEHCTFIAIVVRLTALPDGERFVKRCLLLREVWHSAATADDCKRVMPSMGVLKRHVLAALEAARKWACFVALLQHMLREWTGFGEFLADPAAFFRRHARAHVAEFAAEDAEAQLFAACEVPTLVRSPSPLLDKAVRDQVALALQLKVLSKRALASGVAQSTAGRRGSSGVTVRERAPDFSRDIYPEYVRLQRKHVASSRAFLQQVLPTLDMSADLANLVHQLVTHEIRESIWGASVVRRVLALA
jgi:hypothetical protein